MQTPYWLKKRLTLCGYLIETRAALAECGVNTVCESSLCPNLNECFSSKRMTFLILGKHCTRQCGFCHVEKSDPEIIDNHEAERILEAVKRLGLKYVIITSVTRDDLPDGGASQFVKVVRLIKRSFGNVKVEVLIPDFSGNRSAIEDVLTAGQDVFGHNIETIRRLYPAARRGADYDRSLGVLRFAKRLSHTQITKSGMMVGLGEAEDEVITTMVEIYRTGCDILTIGQYLRPGTENIAVKRFVAPEEFDRYKKIGEDIGFKHVAAGPFVRSSYIAEEIYNKLEDRDYDRSYAAAVS